MRLCKKLLYGASAAMMLVALLPLASVNAQGGIIITVNGETGSDDAACASGAVFASVQRGVRCAISQKSNGVASTVEIAAGTYRESVSIGMGPNNTNTTPIVVRPENGPVVISGANVIDGWVPAGAGLFEQTVDEYPLSLSESTPPGPDGPPRSGLTIRREIVAVNGVNLEQVLSRGAQSAGDGTFFVGSDGLVTISPPDGTLDGAVVEVGLRDFAWRQNNVNNMTIEGIEFRHAVTPWANAQAAVVIGGSNNAVIDGATIHWNNADGLFVGASDNITVANTVANDNGKGGMGTWRLRQGTITDSETSRNNWRGELGGYFSWWVSNKFTYSRGLSILNHVANENQGRGLWLDLDNEDVLIDNVTVEDNRTDGLFIEVSQGPITVSNSRFADNGRNGIRGANSEQVLLEGVELVDNGDAQLFLTADNFDGPRDREDKDWETDQSNAALEPLRLRQWTVRDSFIGQTVGSTAPLVRTTLIDGNANGDDWSIFLEGYEGSGNCYFSPSNLTPFTIATPVSVTSPTDLSGWLTETGETASQFGASRGQCEPVTDGLGIVRLSSPPTIDGYPEPLWDQAPLQQAQNLIVDVPGVKPTQSDFATFFRTGYDATNLYFAIAVFDSDTSNDSAEFWEDDNIEIFIDAGNEGGSTYDSNDYQLVIGAGVAGGDYVVGPNSAPDPGPTFAYLPVGGLLYFVEVAIPHASTGLVPTAGTRFSFDVHATDDDDGDTREHKLAWHTVVDQSWRDPSTFGPATLE